MKEFLVTNPEKILFPNGKIKKIDIVNYYIDICPYMMPFVENRLLSVIRCHENIEEYFFKKHATTDKNFVCLFNDKGEEYFYINKDYHLIYQVQNGTIEFHTNGSNIKNIDKPNIMVFDLDPDNKLSLKKLRASTTKVKQILDELSLTSFLKTSGGKGYHIVIPFSSGKNWDSFYNFSKQIALLIESKWPEEFTTNIKKSERKGKIFIDYLRNNRKSTCVCAYSLRCRQHAPISMPIPWESLNEVYPNEITIKNYKNYLNNSWKSFFDVKQKLK